VSKFSLQKNGLFFSPCFGKGFKGQNHEKAFAIEKGNMEIDDDLTSDDSELRSAEIYMESEIFMFKSSRNLPRISGPPNSFDARPEILAELPAFNYEVGFCLCRP